MALKLPCADEPIGELIDRNTRRFTRKDKRRKAEKWLPIKFAEANKPFGVAWFGDPHLDDENCNWPLLRRNIASVKKAKGCYAASVGDYTNNWPDGGRLSRLHGEQSTNRKDAHRLAAWFLRDCGLNWRFAVMGNHDVWNEGEAVLGSTCGLHAPCLYMPYWEAKLEFRAGVEKWRVHTAHGWKGQSILNPTHGLMRAARYSGNAADLYVGGHTHTVASQSFQLGDKYVRSLLVSGYKGHDRHAVSNCFEQSNSGATGLTIFNPKAASPAGRVLVFEDLEAGLECLAGMRRGR